MSLFVEAAIFDGCPPMGRVERSVRLVLTQTIPCTIADCLRSAAGSINCVFCWPGLTCLTWAFDPGGARYKTGKFYTSLRHHYVYEGWPWNTTRRRLWSSVIGSGNCINCAYGLSVCHDICSRGNRKTNKFCTSIYTNPYFYNHIINVKANLFVYYLFMLKPLNRFLVVM